MRISKKLKWSTLIFHGIILIGANHGGFILGLSLLFLPFAVESSFSFLMLFVILGQIFMLLSLFLKSTRLQKWFFVRSLVLFWLTLVYIIASIFYGEVQMLWMSAIPFIICNIIIFGGNKVQRLWNRAIDQ